LKFYDALKKRKKSTTLYIKAEKENTATSSIENKYYRVDKKTTS
jgi:DNA-dependent RNA polymerase auxiliary subunit epsilon